MALPTIDPYPLPAADDLPANRALWTIDPVRAFLLVHDMQSYFLSPYRADAQPLAGVRAHIRALRDACHRAGVPVVYTVKPGGMTQSQRGLELDFWGPGMTAAERHTAIDPHLVPGADDVLLTNRALPRRRLQRRAPRVRPGLRHDALDECSAHVRPGRGGLTAPGRGWGKVRAYRLDSSLS
ncbi:isochorismatase family protein [Nocardiopsis sp. NPDC049922]|uniref:isochorismatase family protein n=1 Tax=Nocardiopsis sp. NPDC049922 TaxID=3155157 RepID=UPI0033C07467